MKHISAFNMQACTQLVNINYQGSGSRVLVPQQGRWGSTTHHTARRALPHGPSLGITTRGILATLVETSSSARMAPNPPPWTAIRVPGLLSRYDTSNVIVIHFALYIIRSTEPQPSPTKLGQESYSQSLQGSPFCYLGLLARVTSVEVRCFTLGQKLDHAGLRQNNSPSEYREHWRNPAVTPYNAHHSLEQIASCC